AATPSLSWDLGDTKGTVAVRMPMHPVALDLLKEVGPMAVSAANVAGSPAATTAEEAAAQFGDDVSVYLDAGPCGDTPPSTIVDLTYAVPRVLRSGAIGIEQLRAVCGTVIAELKRPERRAAEAGDDGTARTDGDDGEGDDGTAPTGRDGADRP